MDTYVYTTTHTLSRFWVPRFCVALYSVSLGRCILYPWARAVGDLVTGRVEFGSGASGRGPFRPGFVYSRGGVFYSYGGVFISYGGVFIFTHVLCVESLSVMAESLFSPIFYGGVF